MSIGGLGSGLDNLFQENVQESLVTKTVRISDLEPNRDQPRKTFTEETLSSLAESIAKHGVLEPILVRPSGSHYQIIAGERRWRAAQLAGLDEVPVVIRDMSDKDAMAVSLVENLHRDDLNPMEEAHGYAQLMNDFGMTQDEIALQVGKSRSAISNALRLLNLPQDISEMVQEGDLGAGHARALLGIEDPDVQLDMAKKAADEKMTVRQVERAAAKEKKGDPMSFTERGDSYYREVAMSLQEHFGRKVFVDGSRAKGRLIIEFYGRQDLQDFLDQYMEDSLRKYED